MNGQLTAASLAPGEGELIIRMYRTGLGDCFLLAFGAKHGPRYLLIDCGIHQLQTNGSDRLKQVMDDLLQSTNHHLDIVVGTHEHADHLSGIVQKESPFLEDEISISELWLAWTENPRIPQARRLRQKHNTAREIIRKAVKEAQQKAQTVGLSLVDQQSLIAFAEQLEFDADLFEKPDKFDENGELREAKQRTFVEHDVVSKLTGLKQKYPKNVPESELRSRMAVDSNQIGTGANAAAKTKPSSNELALELLVILANQTRYCQPGDMLEIPGISKEDLRVWVLGPPRDEQRLKKDKPSKVRGGGEHEYKEVYLSGLDSARSLARSPLMMDSSDGTEARRSSFHKNRVSGAGLYPFPASDSNEQFIEALEQKPKDAAKKASRKKSSSKGSDYDIFDDLYFDGESDWRRIDHEWLGNAETLALKLDSDTNNTSLVLAFEIGKPGEGPVLLFPGDAQIGNWLSWRDQTYKYGNIEMTADDLLKRTLVYKVGHHGSHNATVKCDPGETNETHPEGVPFGLELMNNIVAMIPTHRKSANKAKGWEMPYKKLYEALREKADHRVLRSDSILEPLKENADPDIVPTNTSFEPVPRMSHPLQWRKSTATFSVDPGEPLYYELKLIL